MGIQRHTLVLASFLIILLFGIPFVLGANFRAEEGETITHTDEGTDFEIEVVQCDVNAASFTVNGRSTGVLHDAETYRFSDEEWLTFRRQEQYDGRPYCNFGFYYTPADDCQDECNNHNERWCVGNEIYQCVPRGCWEVVNIDGCVGSEVCVDGYCSEDCGDVCNFDGDRCIGSSVYRCRYNPATGCSEHEQVDLCDADEVCRNGACVENCISHFATDCYDGNVYWVTNCGEFEGVKEYCGAQEKCTRGQCVPDCDSKAEKRCYGNRPYWYDSCGIREEAADVCDSIKEKCENGVCIKKYDNECSQGQIKCLNDYQYQECVYMRTYESYRWSPTAKNCGSGEKCEDNQCVISISPCPYECCNPNEGYIEKSCDKEYKCDGYRCHALIYCGNGECDVNEDCNSCSQDCGVCQESVQETIEDESQYSEYSNAFQDKILPNEQIVQEAIERLTSGDYSRDVFITNLNAIHEFVSSIPYRYDDESREGDGREGNDYAQSAVETLTEMAGDCEDHAILEQTLIEALYIRTIGYVPYNKVYVLCGCIDFDNDGEQDGCHCWNAININPTSVVSSRNSQIGSSSSRYITMIVNDISYGNIVSNPKEITINLNEIPVSTSRSAATWNNEIWIELEPTWKLPIEEFMMMDYKHTQIWFAVNSKRFEVRPDIVKLFSQERNPVADTDEYKSAGVYKKPANQLRTLFDKLFGIFQKPDNDDVNSVKEEQKSEENYVSEYPIIFVHGWKGEAEVFLEYQEKLEMDGIAKNMGIIDTRSDESICPSGWPTAISVSFEYYTDGKGKGIASYANKLNTAVELVKKCTNKQNVLIVAHSMGGLIARKYLVDFNSDSVENLITLATPNKGSNFNVNPIKKLLYAIVGKKQLDIVDMSPNSEFLRKLNKEDEVYRSKIINIASTTICDDLKNAVSKKDDEFFSRTDCMVLIERSKLKGSANYVVDGCSHTAITNLESSNGNGPITSPTLCSEAYNIVKQYISYY